MQHLKMTLEILRKNQLYAKRSKCHFGCREISYLGHLIYGQGVKANSKKLQSMKNWRLPNSIKALKAFLGLIGYYRRFIKGYGVIVGPLTRMLKKDQFQLSEESKQVFHKLKDVVT